MIKSMNRFLNILFSFFAVVLITSNSAFSQSRTPATVVKVRGDVKAIIQGETKAIKKGDKIPPKAQLESGDKSFAIIVFQDKTKLTLGPKSKIEVVNPSTDSEPGIINLLQGQIRNKITKPGKNNKYFVNSKAAAIGVRGTEFIAIYNPATNSMTSGGFSGVVAIGPPIKGEINLESANNTIKDGGENIYLLKAREFSSVKNVDGKIKISAPRVMSPVQYFQLKNNEEPSFSQISVTKASKEKKRSPALPNITMGERDIFSAHTGSNKTQDIVKGDSQMPAGSYIDLNTGTIIPPTSGSEYDSNAGVFTIDSSMGQISKDGSYIAPDGLVLSETGRFESVSSSETSTKKAQEMNEAIDLAVNTEVLLRNPSSKNVAKNDSSENQRSGSKKSNEGEAIPDAPLLTDISGDLDQILENSDTVPADCAGNICDRFDTAAPTSDEASQKTLVQFTIRINRD